MTHDYKKFKFLRKVVGLFGFKLVEKNFIKNMIEAESIAVSVDTFVDKIIIKNSFTKIIQIGSNDGITDDYVKKIIEKHNLKGILVEPSLEPFKKLKKNYEKINNLEFVNKALDKDLEVKKFYQVGIKYQSFYHANISVLSSFDKNHLVKWGIKSQHIEEINVECINWTNLFKDYNFQDVSIICIDAEGHDHVLIENLIMDTKGRPVIVFEWVNIPNDKFKEILNILKKQNYNFLKFQKDIICCTQDIKY